MEPRHLVRIAFAAVLCLAASSRADERFDFESVQMATKFRITLHAESKAKAEKAADAAFARVAALTAVFSDYEPESELSRLNRAATGEPFAASRELFEIVGRALEISRLSDGAFDITCGQLTRLWRGMRTRQSLPPPDRLATARASMDWRSVKLDPAAKTITLTKPGTLLDLGGIAKGYAADEALRVLREGHHITRALVIAGGDIAIGDPPPGAEGWTIKLRLKSTGTDETVLLRNAAVSTSGGMYQNIIVEGRTYAHIVSPATGLGLTQPVSCSVIAPDCTTSDALATAMCVLGKEKGGNVAARLPGVTVRWAE